MFKEFGKNPQLDMFSSPPSGMLRGSSLKDYLKMTFGIIFPANPL